MSGISNSAVDADRNSVVGDYDEEEVEVEEVEVTDDEAEEEEIEAPPSPPAAKTKLPGKASSSKQKSGGKVEPSDAVKKMQLSSPESKEKAKKGKGKLSPDVNPFPTFGSWDRESFSQVEIEFPVLTSNNETTNELTRSTRPEARYWKGPITFRYGGFISDTIRVNNVHIPFHTAKGYGSSFVYMCLPGYMADAFAEAGKKRTPVRVTENSLVPDKERWWKIANNVEGSFGVINDGMFKPKSLATLFDATHSGVSCSVTLSFDCKASTADRENIRPTTMRTVAVKVERAFINDIGVSVQIPARVKRTKARPTPVANSSDIASDELMKRLSELGL